MQIPSIVKPIGKITGESRVYIEDYAYTYLCERKNGQIHFPTRVALYGHTFCKEEKQFYFIYGASGVIEEMERGRSQEEIGQDYFSEYQLLGYINLYHASGMPGEKEGCFVFYDKNEAMQNYLLSCYKQYKCGTNIEQINEEERKEKVFPWNKKSFVSCFFQKFLLIIMLGITTLAVMIINQYQQMQDFVMMTVKAVQIIG